jgi:hypothetical protein
MKVKDGASNCYTKKKFEISFRSRHGHVDSEAIA